MPKEMASPVEAILGRRFQMCIDLGTHALLATEKHGGIPRGRLATEPSRPDCPSNRPGRTYRQRGKWCPGQARAVGASSSETKRSRYIVR
jgi:hypothetical protein